MSPGRESASLWIMFLRHRTFHNSLVLAPNTRCWTSWDLAPDGRSFLMMRYGEQKPEPETEMILVQNWFEVLKRFTSIGKK